MNTLVSNSPSRQVVLLRSRLAAFTLLVMMAPFSSHAAETSLPAETDLRGELNPLPYEAEIIPRLIPVNQDRSVDSRSFLFLDYNEDGHDDLVRATPTGIVIEDLADNNRVLRTLSLDPDFSQAGRPAFRLSQCPDLDGDGRQEIVAIGHSEKRMNWQLWTINGHDFSLISTTDLPRGNDVRPDGRWDGSYRHATCLAANTLTPFPMVILTCDVGYDQDGRGVLGLDPVRGEVIWEHEVAGVVRAGSMVAGDLDHDGQDEIVMAISPSTLPHGRVINGYHDNESQIVMLNSDGTQRWVSVIAEGYGGVNVAVADANADGDLEVVAIHWTLPNPTGGLHVWNLAGELLTQYATGRPSTGLQVLRSPSRRLPDLLVTDSQGHLEAFQLEGRQLTIRRRLRFPTGCTVNGVIDLLPNDGPEVVVTDKTGSCFVLSSELEPLAHVTTSPLVWNGAAGVVDVGDGNKELFRVGVREGTIAFHRLPVPPTPPNLAIALVIGATFIWIVWLVLKHRRRDLGPDIQREVRLHLLESLELSNHGDVAPLNTVQRLYFCLRALLVDIGDNSRVKIRLGEILSECQKGSLPHLTGIIDRARLAGLTPETVDHAEASVFEIKRIVHQLAALEDISHSSENLIAKLDHCEKEAALRLLKLRQEVALFFRTDPQQAITRVLRANRDRMRQAGIVLYEAENALSAAGGSTDVIIVKASTAPELPTGTSCLIDPLDFELVLDNVIANATNAMKNSARRQLRIEQNLVDGMVQIDITDTGCGIAVPNQDRALNTHYSTKSGGGAGLPASSKILRRYGGQITIARSILGEGTTIRITTMAG